MANKFHALKKIQNLTPEQLSESLSLNGYSQCCIAITERNINGDTFLNLTEFQVKQWKSLIGIAHINRLWSFIQRIKDHPTEFMIAEKVIQSTSQYEGTKKLAENNGPQQSQFSAKSKPPPLKLDNAEKLNTKSVSDLAKVLKMKLETRSFESDEEEQLYMNQEGEFSDDDFEEESIYGNDDIINQEAQKKMTHSKPPLPRKPSADIIPVKKQESLVHSPIAAKSEHLNKVPDHLKPTANKPEVNIPKLNNFNKSESNYPKMQSQSTSNRMQELKNEQVQKEPNYPKLPRSFKNDKESDYPNTSSNQNDKNSDYPRIKKLNPPPNILNLFGNNQQNKNNSTAFNQRPSLNIPNRRNENDLRKFQSPSTRPPLIPPQSPSDEEDLPEYDECNIDGEDDEGYLLASEINGSDDEKNWYEDPQAEKSPQIATLPPKLRNRPLPSPPKEPPEGKTYIEFFAKQEEERKRKALLDLKFKIDQESENNARKQVDVVDRPPLLPPLPDPPSKPVEFKQLPVPTITEITRRAPSPSPSVKENEANPFLDDATNSPFYRNIERNAADALLSNLEDGAFLLRPSRKFYCTLSAKYKNRIYNIGIIKNKNNKLECISENCTITFNSASELVEYYLSNPLQTFDQQKRLTTITLRAVLPPNIF